MDALAATCVTAPLQVRSFDKPCHLHAPHVEFVRGTGEMRFRGAFRYEHASCDLGVGAAFGGEQHGFALPGGQRVQQGPSLVTPGWGRCMLRSLMSCLWLAGLNCGVPSHMPTMRRMMSSGASVLDTNPSAPASTERSTVLDGFKDVRIST